MSSASIAPLPFVEGSLSYLIRMADKPRNVTFKPPPGVPGTSARYERRTTRIHDMRPIAQALALDREGFRLVTHHTAVSDFYDDAALRRVAYPEVERLVAAQTGADRIVVFDHTVRRRVPGALDRMAGVPRQPSQTIHVDYSERSGPQRVRDLMGDEADALLRQRFAIVNVWRPIRGPLRDAPLAVCDAASVPRADLVASDLVYAQRTGENYTVTWRASHRWFYAPDMRANEALLLKCYDSSTDGRARFVPHTAFTDPTAPSDVLPRESIEFRTFAFYAGNAADAAAARGTGS